MSHSLHRLAFQEKKKKSLQQRFIKGLTVKSKSWSIEVGQ